MGKQNMLSSVECLAKHVEKNGIAAPIGRYPLEVFEKVGFHCVQEISTKGRNAEVQTMDDSTNSFLETKKARLAVVFLMIAAITVLHYSTMGSQVGYHILVS